MIVDAGSPSAVTSTFCQCGILKHRTCCCVKTISGPATTNPAHFALARCSARPDSVFYHSTTSFRVCLPWEDKRRARWLTSRRKAGQAYLRAGIVTLPAVCLSDLFAWLFDPEFEDETLFGHGGDPRAAAESSKCPAERARFARKTRKVTYCWQVTRDQPYRMITLLFDVGIPYFPFVA